MDSTIKQKHSPKETAWEQSVASYSCANIIRFTGIHAALEAYIFKSRGVLKEKDDLEQIFEKDTQGRNGIYFLYDRYKTKVYVGKTEESYKRIVGHNNANPKSEWYYNDWDEAILFITKDDRMTPAERDELEAIFIKLFKNSVEDTISLNKKNEKIKDRYIDKGRLAKMVEAIKEKLVEMKLMDKNAQVDIGESTDADIKSLIQEASIELKNEIKESQDSKVIFLDKLLKYEDLREKVSHANNLIFRNRILSSIINRKALDEVTTPRAIAEEMVKNLPNEVFDGKHTFFDPACKSGIFLQLILEKLMSDDKNLPINHDTDFKDRQNRLKYIIDKLIFGVALSPNGLCVIQHTLIETIEKLQSELETNGNRLKTIDRVTTIPHIICLEDYKIKIRDKDLSKKIEKAFEAAGVVIEKQGEEMKFDVVIGNPPYQTDSSSENSNTRNTKIIYDRFIELGIDMCADDGYVSMITNNTFLCNDAKSKLRGTMIEAGLSDMVNYPISGEVFPGVGVSACCFLIDKNNKAHDFYYKQYEKGEITAEYETTLDSDSSIYQNGEMHSLKRKLVSDKNMNLYSLGNKAFGIANDFKVGFADKDKFTPRPILDTFEQNGPGLIGALYGTAKNVARCYIRESDIPKDKEHIHKYKLVTKEVVSKSGIDNVANTIILDGTCINVGGWSVCAVSDNLEEIKNIEKYMKTKLFRMCILLYSSEGMTHLNNQMYGHIPAHDFAVNSDINWSLSVAEIDQQLYKKYNLSEEEIAYVESTIKTMA